MANKIIVVKAGPLDDLQVYPVASPVALQGEKGYSGYSGAAGPRGIQGPVGPQGPPGTGAGEEQMVYSKRVDFISENQMYKGEAAVGSSESSALWRIRKIDIGVDGDVTQTWANGNSNFTNRWIDRLTLTYS